MLGPRLALYSSLLLCGLRVFGARNPQAFGGHSPGTSLAGGPHWTARLACAHDACGGEHTDELASQKKRPASVSSRRPKCAPTRQARLGDRRGLCLLRMPRNSASNSDVAARFTSSEATPQRRLHRLDRVVPARSRRAANPERGRAAHRRLVACAQSLPWPCGHLLTRGGKQSRHVNRSATPRRKPSRQPMHAWLTEPCERSRLCPRSRTALLRAPDCANAVRPSRALTHLSDLPRSASGHSSAKESS